MENQLNVTLKACEEMIREGSTTFYKAFGFLDSPRKEAVYVIYAFCRMIDNAVDEPERSPYTLNELEQHFKQLEAADGHFIWPALRWLLEEFPITKEPFFRQMEGQRLDHHLTHYDTIDQLETYSYFVAGTVGEMLLPILHDAPDETVTASGIWLGKAMQIVNIVRDVGEDRGKGRRYIPLELLARHGYTEEMWKLGVVNDAWRNAVMELIGLAQKWFIKGLADINRYPRTSSFCVELSARMYAAILDDVVAHDFDVYSRRAYVPKLNKVSIMTLLKLQHGMSALQPKTKASSAVS
ncbi:phytoene/squalene synthase family protein [Paenibacillus sinopodophylli]|uniref:phytoene/squalene synthase family protein n=1 Tax=Paenibacillus sinopodophylli TaxID=1837342 RepID=UPI001FEAEE42|nr:phytoene/squalene synthase family protein [Paenibacillus sinopodophylli]